MNIFIGITGIIGIIILSFVTLIFIAITGTKIMKINIKNHNLLNELNFWVRIPDLREQIINIYILNNKTEEEGKKDATLILQLIGSLIIYINWIYWSTFLDL